jgi:hypothetical protein
VSLQLLRADIQVPSFDVTAVTCCMNADTEQVPFVMLHLLHAV